MHKVNLHLLFLLWFLRAEPFLIIIDVIQGQEFPADECTISDKLKPEELDANLKAYEEKLFETWETMPGYFISSAETGEGKEKILDFIEGINHPQEQLDWNILR